MPSKNICSKCNDAITTGGILNALEKKWHPQCFRCSDCESPLADVPFHVKDHKAFCATCWTEKFQPKCSMCTKPVKIEEQYVNFKDKPFHQNCFKCDKCSGQLAGRQFCMRGERKLCHDCLKSK